MSPRVAEAIVLYSGERGAHQQLMSIYEQRDDKDMMEQAACVFTVVTERQ